VRSLRFDKDTNSSQNMNSLLWFNFNWFICLLLVIVVSFSYPSLYIISLILCSFWMIGNLKIHVNSYR